MGDLQDPTDGDRSSGDSMRICWLTHGDTQAGWLTVTVRHGYYDPNHKWRFGSLGKSSINGL